MHPPIVYLLKKSLISTGLLLIFFFNGRAQQTALAEETLLLMENFDDNTANSWPAINHGDSAIAGIKNGHYVLDILHSSRFWALRLGFVEGLTATPDLLEMKMKLTGEVKAAYGILWSTVKKSERIFDEYSFLLNNADGAFAIFQRVDGKTLTIKEWTDCSCINTKDYNVLRIEESPGAEHRFYINGQLVYQGNMPATNLAGIGFYCDAHTILSTDYIKLAKK